MKHLRPLRRSLGQAFPETSGSQRAERRKQASADAGEDSTLSESPNIRRPPPPTPSGLVPMALLGSAVSAITSEVGLRLLLNPLGSNIVIRTACCTVGIALPVYSTFKAIEKNDRDERDRWLLYWSAYGSFSIVEVFSDKILSWFPLYYHMKFAFLVWLQLPSGNGSRHLYARHLRPFLLRHQARLDNLLSSASREIAKFTSTHQGEIQFLMALLRRCAVTANQMVKDIIQPAQSGGQNVQNVVEGRNAPTGHELPHSESTHDD